MEFFINIKRQPTCSLRPVILNNACPPRITAAAGTKLAGTNFSKQCHNLYLNIEFYNQYSLLHSRHMAGSGFRPLSKIPHCCRSKASGPCLSPSVADHPLRPAKDLWLGELLPHQLPNPTQAHLLAVIYLFYIITAKLSLI